MSAPDLAVDVQIDEKIKVDLAEPRQYKVVLLNDDETPVDFVIQLLMSVFKHTEETARQITLTVHNDGAAVAGVYTFEIAEQKGLEATNQARASGYPLQIKVDQD